MIDNKQFKIDFNEGKNKINNTELIKKYGFNSFKDCLKYAEDNNLIIKRKCELNEGQIKSLKDSIKFIKGVLK